MSTIPDNRRPDCEGRQRFGAPEVSELNARAEILPGESFELPPGIENNITVAVLSKTIIEKGELKGREQRVERVTLSSGNTHTGLITEADPETVMDEQPDEPVKINFHVPGLGEIPSVENSSAHNLHDVISARTPKQKTVSFDRHGYSPEDPIGSPINTIKTGFETTMATATDLLELAEYYSEGAKTTVYATSAGTEKAIKMADLNELTGNKVNLAEEIRLVVPHLRVPNMPGQPEAKTMDQTLVRLDGIFKFAKHVPVNLTEMLLTNPKKTLGCLGIAGSLAKNPLLALSLPPRLIRHTEGIDYHTLARVLSSHTFNIIAGENDPLNDSEQTDHLQSLFPGRIMVKTILKAGHLLPIDHNIIADHFLPVDGDEKDTAALAKVIQFAGKTASTLAERVPNPVGWLQKAA